MKQVALTVAAAPGRRESFEEKARLRRLLIIDAVPLGALLVLATVLRHLGG